ncbi:hypothetical protein D1007_44610 [Hordeum vulgare]|nr:hypothetical protein D1007_44610 [Hordeum vulgare]
MRGQISRCLILLALAGLLLALLRPLPSTTRRSLLTLLTVPNADLPQSPSAFADATGKKIIFLYEIPFVA